MNISKTTPSSTWSSESNDTPGSMLSERGPNIGNWETQLSQTQLRKITARETTYKYIRKFPIKTHRGRGKTSQYPYLVAILSNWVADTGFRKHQKFRGGSQNISGCSQRPKKQTAEIPARHIISFTDLQGVYHLHGMQKQDTANDSAGCGATSGMELRTLSPR